MKYQYIGEIEVSIDGIGVIQPQQIVDANEIINNPLFQKLEDQKATQSEQETPWKD